jgi:hypothetical protein
MDFIRVKPATCTRHPSKTGISALSLWVFSAFSALLGGFHVFVHIGNIEV